MIMGGYGPLTFGVSGIGRGTLLQDLNKQSKLRWADHNILSSKTLLEFTGWEADEVTLTMLFIEGWCTSPSVGMSELDALSLFPIPFPLIVGNRPVGSFASTFVISECRQHWRKCNHSGRVSVAEVSATFREKSLSAIGSYFAFGGLARALPK